jgi:hypothetical protein
VIDGVLAWSTASLDRHRAMDRLNDLRLAPWGEADGDGAIFRLAAAKAACARLVEAMPELDADPMPELLVAAGGIFSIAAAIGRCPGAGGPGSPGRSEPARHRPSAPARPTRRHRGRGRAPPPAGQPRRRHPAAARQPDTAGRRQGRAQRRSHAPQGASSISEIELHPGAVQVVDLPPGRAARADLEFRDAVRLGKRGHHFSVDVGGGMCGLLVDLRDIPMRISDRPDSRRAAWTRGSAACGPRWMNEGGQGGATQSG